MNEKQQQILQTASETFMRYGVRRTTMSEIATAAKVSRPTLYGFYANKEDLLGGVIAFWNALMIETMQADLDKQSTLSGKLDVYFDHAVLKVYDLMKSWPDASDVVTEDNQVAMAAYMCGLAKQTGVVEQILTPYAASIQQAGQTVPHYAEFIVSTGSKLKKNLDSRDQLQDLLLSLKISVLSVAQQRGD